MNYFYKVAVSAICVAGITAFEASASGNLSFASQSTPCSSLVANDTPQRQIAPPGDDDQYITVQPEGTETILNKKGTGYGSIFSMVYKQDIEGCAAKLVVNGEKAYLYGPWSCRPSEGWMEGVIEGDVITFQLPQLVKKGEDFMGNPVYEYAVKLEEGIDEWSGQTTFVISEDQSYKLKIENDGSLSDIEEGKMIGSASYYLDWSGESGEWYWSGAGDIISSWVAFNAQPEVAPDTLTFEDYYYIAGTGYSADIYKFSLAIEGDKVWLKNVAQTPSLYDNCWVGDFDSSTNTMTFKSSQYLGVDWDKQNIVYALGATWEDGVEPGSGGEPVAVVLYSYADEVVFSYDPENHTLYTPDAFLTARMESGNYILNAYHEPIIKLQPSDFVAANPQAPYIESFYPGDEYTENAQMYFILPMLDVDMQVLDLENMYFSIYLDDELFVFTKSAYKDLPEEEMTEIPALGFPQESPKDLMFVDNWLGGSIITSKPYNRIGVQSVYHQGDHVTRSIISYDQTDAINEVIDNGELVEETFFDMQGREVRNPGEGFYISRATYSNGTVITRKVIKNR